MSDRYIVGIDKPRGVVRRRQGAEGALFPDAIDVIIADMDSYDLLRLRFQVIEERPVLVGVDAETLTYQPRELASDEIHGLTEKLISNAMRYASHSVGSAEDGARITRSRRRHVITPEFLGEVLAVANAHKGRERKAVEEHFGVPSRTANRWIADARKNDEEGSN